MAGPRVIWMVARELHRVACVGGVGMVVAQKAEGLARHGIQVVVVMPYYACIKPDGLDIRDTGVELDLPVDYSPVMKRRTRAKAYEVVDWAPGCTVYLIHAPCFEKEGVYTYTRDEAERCGHSELAGRGYPDYFEQNVTLQKAALELSMSLGAHPDVVECHDAQAALIPAMMRTVLRYKGYFRHVAAVVVMHNGGPAYNQEVYDVPFARAITEIPSEVILRGLHRGGVFPFILGGLNGFGDVITVSENYAREILEDPVEDERTGGIGTAFRTRGIHLGGITNGVRPTDYDPTNPARMKIAAAYNPAVGDLTGKRTCRTALIREVAKDRTPKVRFVGRLEDDAGSPLIITITRLTQQKGIDRIVPALRQLMSDPATQDARVLVLGAGEPLYEDALSQLAGEFEGRVVAALGHNEELANRVFSAGDLFVNAAEYAPCDITDYAALLMGAAPVVHHVGGLVKVQDGITGYAYKPHTAEALAAALRAAIETFTRRPEQHLRLIQQGIRLIHERYTWDKVLERSFLPLYQLCIERAMVKDIEGRSGAAVPGKRLNVGDNVLDGFAPPVGQG